MRLLASLLFQWNGKKTRSKAMLYIFCPEASLSLKTQNFLNQALSASGFKNVHQVKALILHRSLLSRRECGGVCSPGEEHSPLEILPTKQQEMRASSFPYSAACHGKLELLLGTQFPVNEKKEDLY